MGKKDPGVDYREAKAAVAEHLKAWADAELAKVTWLKRKRGVPTHVLYDPKTGEARDAELRALEQAEVDAHADYEWCKALVVACGEIVKGRSFDNVLAAQGPKPTQAELMKLVEEG